MASSKNLVVYRVSTDNVSTHVYLVLYIYMYMYIVLQELRIKLNMQVSSIVWRPGIKNQTLGTLGDFVFVVDYVSMISL